MFTSVKKQILGYSHILYYCVYSDGTSINMAKKQSLEYSPEELSLASSMTEAVGLCKLALVTKLLTLGVEHLEQNSKCKFIKV